MSLDAVVYKSINNLKLKIDLNFVEIDEATGEVFINDINISKQYAPESFISIEIRLGNISEILEIKEEINHRLSDELAESIILSKVLYSCSHSGDKLDISEIDKLKLELEHIDCQTKECRTESLENFLRNMFRLLQTSEHEKNPIVFV